MFLLPVLAWLPRAVLSAVIMVVAIQHVDASTIQIVGRLASRRVANRASLTLDLLVIALVATLSIVLNIVLAVFVGLGIAIVLFIARVSRSPIRRTYRADTVSSRRQRSERQGAIATGDRHLLLTNFDEHSQWGRMLRDVGVTTETRDRSFPDSDRAIEWAEDQIIAATSLGEAVPTTCAVENLEVFRGLSETGLASLRPLLEARRYTSGDVIIAEGARESDLFFITQGSASVHLREQDGRATRIASFSSGTVIGELALLDRAPRSATVVADDELACFVLTEAAFRQLMASHPSLAMNLVASLAREVSGRLRRATQTIRHLAS